MADPITIIGSVGALCNIIDVVSKAISTISTLRSRWRDADLTLLSLAAQFTALRAALCKTQEWMNRESEEVHHQLTMDLDVAISCCKMLVDKMDVLFCELDLTNEPPLDGRGKVRLLLNNANFEELQRLVERQTSALTLLLTACNCKAISDQRRILEQPESRTTLERAMEDSISLFVHCDAASFITASTDNMSRMSHVFDFDSQLVSSKVYKRAIREIWRSKRKSIKKRPPTPGPKAQPVTSRWVPGTGNGRRFAPLSLSPEPRSSLPSPPVSSPHGPHEKPQTPRVRVKAVKVKWIPKDDRRLSQSSLSEPELPSHLPGCGHAFQVYNEMILLAGEEDGKAKIANLLHDSHLLQQAPCEHGGHTVICTSKLLQSKKSSHALLTIPPKSVTNWKGPCSGPSPAYPVHFIVFAVDLCGYDKVSPETVGTQQQLTMLDKNLLLFQNHANVEPCRSSTIMLLFNNVHEFNRKLRVSPLQRHLLDFEGGSDSEKAVKFIQTRFQASVSNPGRVLPWRVQDNPLDIQAFKIAYQTTRQPVDKRHATFKEQIDEVFSK